jgi:hypothetical protein
VKVFPFSTEKRANPEGAKKKKKKAVKEANAQEEYTTITSSTTENAKNNITEDILTFGSGSTSNGVYCSLPSSYDMLCEDDTLKLKYAVKIMDSDRHKVAVGIVLQNKSVHTIRRIELNVLETLNVKLERNATRENNSAILLPFELPSEVKNEHTLHFFFKDVSVSQKIRGNVTYFSEQNDGGKSEAKIDFTLSFPSIRFLKFATIGSTSYEFMLSGDDLPCSSTAKCLSSQPLASIIEQISVMANVSVVENLADAVSLYAHSADDQPVCLLLKKQNDNVSVSSKCADQKLAYAIAQDIVDVIGAFDSLS